jgi:hypothetical protein
LSIQIDLFVIQFQDVNALISGNITRDAGNADTVSNNLFMIIVGPEIWPTLQVTNVNIATNNAFGQ